MQCGDGGAQGGRGKDRLDKGTRIFHKRGQGQDRKKGKDKKGWAGGKDGPDEGDCRDQVGKGDRENWVNEEECGGNKWNNRAMGII